MRYLLEKLLAALWNRPRGRRRGAWQEGGSLDLGLRIPDEEVRRLHVRLSTVRRTMHVAVLRKTGSGKSSLLRHRANQDTCDELSMCADSGDVRDLLIELSRLWHTFTLRRCELRADMAEDASGLRACTISLNQGCGVGSGEPALPTLVPSACFVAAGLTARIFRKKQMRRHAAERKPMPSESALTVSRPTIFVAHAPASVMVLEGNFEQIQFLLGHASVQPTEQYIGCRQSFRGAVNDRFHISLANNAP
jgi:hypothetical protein